MKNDETTNAGAMTPGPWRASYVTTPEGIEDCDFYLKGSNHHSVCKCVCPYGLNEERKANMMAIVAVPDLIAALEYAVMYSSDTSVINTALAALQKAGVTP